MHTKTEGNVLYGCSRQECPVVSFITNNIITRCPVCNDPGDVIRQPTTHRAGMRQEHADGME